VACLLHWPLVKKGEWRSSFSWRRETDTMAGVGDKIVGKAEELKGKATGDRSEEAKGKARQTKGEVKGAASRAKHKVEDKLDKNVR
jgi:uncharacterized protein YjbJ (UPF0337 family)